MATQTDEIIVRFRTEGGDSVSEAFKRSGDAADHYHQRVTKVGGALGDLRLKAEARVANNIGAIAQAMSSGAGAADVLALAVTRVGESFRGSLLFAAAATVGIGLYQGITKIGEAVIKLNSDVARLTTPKVGADFLSTDQIKKNLNDISELQQKIFEQQVNRTHSLWSTLAGTGGAGPLAGVVPALNAGDQEKIDRLRKSAINSIDQLTQKQRQQNEVDRQAISGNVLLSQLEAARIAHMERLGAVARSTAPQGASTDALSAGLRLLGAENDKYDNITNSIIKQAVVSEVELEKQHEIANIQKQLLPQAEENLAILNARIAAVKALLSGTTQLSDTERKEYQNQLDQLEATKARAEFARRLEIDLAGLELGRVRGGVGSNRAAILEKQRLRDQADALSPNSPETQRAEAGLEDEQFRQFQEYEKNPAAFRQKRINEQHERNRFQYLRAHGQLPGDIASHPDRSIAESAEAQRAKLIRGDSQDGSQGTNKVLLDIYKVLQNFEKKVDVG